MIEILTGSFTMALGVMLGVWIQHRKQTFQTPFAWRKPDEPDTDDTYQNTYQNKDDDD